MPLSPPTAVVLAAGGSSRLGRDKLTLDLGGVPLLERTIACYTKATRVEDVLVVLPPGGKEAWSFLASLRVHLVENPDPSRGMISSIRTALESAWVKGKDFLVAPADVPFVKPEIVDKIVVAFRARRCDILLPTYLGMGGHPGMYSADVQRDFFLHGDRQGAREVILRHRERTVRLAVPDPDVCFDVDTDEDVRRAMDPGARWARVDADLEARGRPRAR
jgi:CTP:molybdopterin cytidylyltransferase MocA